MSNDVKFAPQRSSTRRLIRRFRKDDSGATAIEYGLIVSLIVIAIIAAVKNFGATTNEMYSEIETEINTAIE
ncbi:MAG: Flp family type IVb pilin [Alphaproteobacteria bacterium]|nr:Flp family type IVb pilin [Alphaproteobacteria bacterium]